jgi:hypothetical protein
MDNDNNNDNNINDFIREIRDYPESTTKCENSYEVVIKRQDTDIYQYNMLEDVIINESFDDHQHAIKILRCIIRYLSRSFYCENISTKFYDIVFNIASNFKNDSTEKIEYLVIIDKSYQDNSYYMGYWIKHLSLCDEIFVNLFFETRESIFVRNLLSVGYKPHFPKRVYKLLSYENQKIFNDQYIKDPRFQKGICEYRDYIENSKEYYEVISKYQDLTTYHFLFTEYVYNIINTHIKKIIDWIK